MKFLPQNADIGGRREPQCVPERLSFRGCVVGNNVKVQNNVSVYSGVILEHEFCGPSAVFTNVVNPRSHVPRRDEYKQTLVMRGAQHRRQRDDRLWFYLGRYCFIGAGAVVTRDTPDYALPFGNPARTGGWVCSWGMKLNQATVSTTHNAIPVSAAIVRLASLSKNASEEGVYDNMGWVGGPHLTLNAIPDKSDEIINRLSEYRNPTLLWSAGKRAARMCDAILTVSSCIVSFPTCAPRLQTGKTKRVLTRRKDRLRSALINLVYPPRSRRNLSTLRAKRLPF